MRGSYNVVGQNEQDEEKGERDVPLMRNCRESPEEMSSRLVGGIVSTNLTTIGCLNEPPEFLLMRLDEAKRMFFVST